MYKPIVWEYQGSRNSSGAYQSIPNGRPRYARVLMTFTRSFLHTARLKMWQGTQKRDKFGCYGLSQEAHATTQNYDRQGGIWECGSSRCSCMAGALKDVSLTANRVSYEGFKSVPNWSNSQRPCKQPEVDPKIRTGG